MQATTLDSRRLPTVPALAHILPGGGLQSGGSYTVRNSTTLAMALLAGPSSTGAWCSVIGMPDFSVEAAEGFGINLDRLILVPDPGSQWLTVTAALVDVVSVILTRAPDHLAPTEWARLKARLRQRGAALITLGNWKQSDATPTWGWRTCRTLLRRRPPPSPLPDPPSPGRPPCSNHG